MSRCVHDAGPAVPLALLEPFTRTRQRFHRREPGTIVRSHWRLLYGDYSWLINNQMATLA